MCVRQCGLKVSKMLKGVSHANITHRNFLYDQLMQESRKAIENT